MRLKVKVINNGGTSWKRSDFRWHWDIPRARKLAYSDGSVVLCGWIFRADGQIARQFRAVLGNREISEQRNVLRPDVVEVHANAPFPVPSNAGFDIRFRTGPGIKRIKLVADFADGCSVVLGHRYLFSGNNSKYVLWWKRLKHRGIQEKRIQHLRRLYRADKAASDHPRETDHTLDVIIPIYRGIGETQACLESIYASLPHNRTRFEIIAINDASPEPELIQYLENEAATGRITLLSNPANLGFVGTTNRGICLHPDRDCILLNSDTEVYGNWVDRMVACVEKDPRIATVTPFSNNATICSYPEIAKDNAIPEGLSPQLLDQLCSETNPGVVHDIPTGVGFCFYMRRKVIDDVGYFDMDTFGRGYGEENDFCLRAALRGWRNVHLCDTFVYHKGAVSFTHTSQPRILDALVNLNNLHPGYDLTIADFISRDPASAARNRLDLARLSKIQLPRVLFVSHARGGGTYRHCLELSQLLRNKAVFFIVTPTEKSGHRYRIETLPSRTVFNTSPSSTDYSGLLDFCREAGIGIIHYHHIIDFDDRILELPEKIALPYDVTLHDYYAICPHITLTPQGRNYCGLPNKTSCVNCLKRYPVAGINDITAFRERHRSFLSGARRVIVPSQWMLEALSPHLPDIKLSRIYHPELPRKIKAFHTTRKELSTRTVGILGALSREKGADLLESVVEGATQRKLPIRFVLFGYAYRRLLPAGNNRLIVTGRYNDKDLDSLLQQYKPDIIWFPAQWPETYSYTLSESLARGYPILAPDIGAFPERLRGIRNARIIPWSSQSSEINDHLLEMSLEQSPNNPFHPDRSSDFYLHEYLQDGLDLSYV